MTDDRILFHLKVDGWCVVPGVIPEEEVVGIRESLEATAASHSPSDWAECKEIRFQGLININQSIAPYLSDERILGACEGLLGQYVRIMDTGAAIGISNQRGRFHPDWPFAQDPGTAGKILAPYPDLPMEITTIWMLSSFTADNGGTIMVSGSHKQPNNPTGDNGVDLNKPYPTEIQATGNAGSVLIFDSRIWHAAAVNHTEKRRTAAIVRYIPWWFNINLRRQGSIERALMVEEPDMVLDTSPLVPLSVYNSLPENVKPLFRHWVEG